MSTIHQCGSNKNIRLKKKHTCMVKSLQRCPHKKGVVQKVRITTPKKPNSAKRRVARVRLSNNFMVTTKIKGRGHNLQHYSVVLVCGGRANDLPGVRYNMIKGKFDFSWKEDYVRKKSRSKYGISVEDLADIEEN